MDWSVITLTLKLAACTTAILLIIAIPFAWWLAQNKSWIKHPVSALVTLPLILPPTVLGFYLLLFLGPNGPLGSLGIESLAFSFTGLVIASVIYSFPFAVQPLQTSFEQIDTRLLEASSTLGASPVDRFMTVILPLAKPGLLSATVLSFAHTIGEFGVILMIGGNIPGETRVLSIAIYDHVENLQYEQAHYLAGGMILFSFLVVWLLYTINHKQRSEG